MSSRKLTLRIALAFAFVAAVPLVASAYCQVILKNPFNFERRERFSAPTCREAIARCKVWAHGPQRCYIVSGY